MNERSWCHFSILSNCQYEITGLKFGRQQEKGQRGLLQRTVRFEVEILPLVANLTGTYFVLHSMLPVFIKLV